MAWVKVLEKRANSRKPWVVRREHDGRHSEKGFRLKADADAFRAKIDHDMRAGIFTEPDTTTPLTDYFEVWLRRHAAARQGQLVECSSQDRVGLPLEAAAVE